MITLMSDTSFDTVLFDMCFIASVNKPKAMPKILGAEVEAIIRTLSKENYSQQMIVATPNDKILSFHSEV